MAPRVLRLRTSRRSDRNRFTADPIKKKPRLYAGLFRFLYCGEPRHRVCGVLLIANPRRKTATPAVRSGAKHPSHGTWIPLATRKWRAEVRGLGPSRNGGEPRHRVCGLNRAFAS